MSKEWEGWPELRQDAQFLKLIAACDETLAKAREGYGKGDGEGVGL